MKYWLLKSEPHVYSIDNLNKDTSTIWEGVRNYQARNYIKTMTPDDLALFYHSSCESPGVYGLMIVSSDPFPDPSAANKKSPFYDSKRPEAWSSVKVTFMKQYSVPLLLSSIKTLPIGECQLIKRGNRLSVIPLTVEQFSTLKAAVEELQNNEEYASKSKKQKV